MNIFYIPSWYPISTNSAYGFFIKEQIETIGRAYPHWHLGVSTWGRGEKTTMLWVKDHLKNVPKVVRHFQHKPEEHHLENIHHYHTPTLTWTRKLCNGNMKGLVRTNLRHLRKFEKTYGPVTVIHAQASYPAAIIASKLAEITKKPYVVTERMGPFPFPEFLDKKGEIIPLLKDPLRKASKIIAISNSLAHRLHTHGLTNVEIVHNPVNTKYWTLKAQHTLNERNILSVGRMEPNKGYDTLLRAVAKLSQPFLAKLRIVGHGEYLEDYQKLSKKLGIDDHVQWMGLLSRERVREEMQNCSFLVLTSTYETFGNVVAEAMACGKPVLSTRCGGPEDIVTEETGIMCEPENVEDLAAKLEWMIAHYREFDPVTVRESVVRRFAPEDFVKKMEAIYREVSGESSIS